MSAYPSMTKANLSVVDGPAAMRGQSLEVHFNPNSLQLTLSSELKDNSRNGPKQYIAKATAKLKMELIFDTTGTGESVLLYTAKLQAFVVPPNFQAPDRQHPTQTPPPTVKFDWGAIAFQGVAEGYQETIDFFSADGVPLRATVSLTLSQQDRVFEDRSNRRVRGGVSADFAVTTRGMSPSELANRARQPGAARGTAAANGLESLRAPAKSVGVPNAVTLNGPTAFASAAAGASVGVAASASAGASLSAGASMGLSGGLTGLSASEGAFAGLGVGAAVTAVGPQLDAQAVTASLRSSVNAGVVVDAGAGIRVGGRATVGGPAGLRADVGVGETFGGRLKFEP